MPSRLFDEVAVMLPAAIKQPILNTLAINVQAKMLETATLIPNPDSTSNHVNIVNVNARQHDLATRLLQCLYQTPNADAAVLVAITHEQHPKLLLTRRASHLNSHAGEVSFAGGKHDLADGNNVVTALREAYEETALPPNRVHLIGQLPTQTSKSGLSVRPIVALVDPKVCYVAEVGEIERIFWADFEALIELPTVDYHQVYRQGAQTIHYTTPSWIVDNETVWGLTGRIIASLLEVAFERQIEWYYRPTIT